MNKAKVALQLFLIAVFFYIVSIFFDLEVLELVSKPMIIPSISMYYLFKVGKKYSILFLISLLFFFIGDMLYMLNIEELYYFGLFVFSFPYLFVIYFIIKDIIVFKRRDGSKIDSTFIAILFILSILMFSVLSFLEIKTVKEFIVYLFLGLQLVALGVLTSIAYYNESNKQSFYLILTVASFIMSDLFFILNKNIHELIIFKIINGLAQSLSYLFYVKYFLERSK